MRYTMGIGLNSYELLLSRPQFLKKVNSSKTIVANHQSKEKNNYICMLTT